MTATRPPGPPVTAGRATVGGGELRSQDNGSASIPSTPAGILFPVYARASCASVNAFRGNARILRGRGEIMLIAGTFNCQPAFAVVLLSGQCRPGLALRHMHGIISGDDARADPRSS
jgi:hypothetical protein